MNMREYERRWEEMGVKREGRMVTAEIEIWSKKSEKKWNISRKKGIERRREEKGRNRTKKGIVSHKNKNTEREKYNKNTEKKKMYGRNVLW